MAAVRADPQGQRQQRDHRKSRVSCERSQGVAQVEQQDIHEESYANGKSQSEGPNMLDYGRRCGVHCSAAGRAVLFANRVRRPAANESTLAGARLRFCKVGYLRPTICSFTRISGLKLTHFMMNSHIARQVETAYGRRHGLILKLQQT